MRAASPAFARPAIGERDLLTINYTSGTTSRPKGVMITHRNAYMNTVGTLLHMPMRLADRYLWTLPMFHANGWTFTWIVTAVGATHVCLRKVDPAQIFELIARERVTMLCAAPTVLIGIANAPAEVRGRRAAGRARPDRRRAAGGGDDRARRGRARLDDHARLRPHRDGAVHHHLRAAPRARRARRRRSARVIKARQGVELITSGELRVVDEDGREVPRDGATVGEIVVRGNVVMKGYYDDPEATAVALRGGYFHTGDAAVVHPDGYVEIRDRLKDVIISGGENISSVEVEGVLLRHPAVQEVAVVGHAGREVGRGAARVRRAEARRARRRRRSCAPSRASGSRTSSARTASPSSPSCRRPRPARFRSSSCAAASRRSRHSDEEGTAEHAR